MILTTKGRYAVLAALYIAKFGEERSIPLFEISQFQNISLNYLEQIFAKLKKEGIVTSVRGPGGGYKLTKSPEEIDIHKITKAVEEEIKITQCGNSKKKACLPKSVKCMAHDLWNSLEDNITDFLESMTLADVIKQTKKESNIYLDYNATSPVCTESIKAMNEVMSKALNPSSVHFHGRCAKSILENSRTEIANNLWIKLGREGYDICFTSSGTEANNLLLHNFANKQIAISNIEHLSILAPAEENPNRMVVEVDQDGLIDLEDLEQKLQTMEKGSLLSVIYANNETGTIQNMKKIIEIAHKYEILVHSDCCQAFAKIPLNIEKLGLDFATISSHKIGGPIGAAALIHRHNFQVKPQIIGGGQEKSRRAGTENVAAIAGFGVAASICSKRIDRMKNIKTLRDELEKEIISISPESIIFGSGGMRLPNTLMINMPNVDAQTQMIYFDMNGISISSGSACSSGKVKASHVIKSMGFGEDIAKSVIRISLGPDTKKSDIEKFIEVWGNLYKKNNKKVA